MGLDKLQAIRVLASGPTFVAQRSAGVAIAAGEPKQGASYLVVRVCERASPTRPVASKTTVHGSGTRDARKLVGSGAKSAVAAFRRPMYRAAIG